MKEIIGGVLVNIDCEGCPDLDRENLEACKAKCRFLAEAREVLGSGDYAPQMETLERL
jgi:hypothetical protein